MKFVVTGATGFIGGRLCQRLAADGHEVVAVYRSQEKRSALDNIPLKAVRGDVTDPEFLDFTLRDCDGCFHLAAVASAWHRDPGIFTRVNVDGTANVFRAALSNRLKRVVFTSTASVFGPAPQRRPADELSTLNPAADSLYEESKIRCEAAVQEFKDQNLDVVTVYPSRVFGPGSRSESNALTKIFELYYRNRWRLIPGRGTSVGNYVFVDDCVDGHVRAMSRGAVGGKYLLGGENLSFSQITGVLDQTMNRTTRFIHIPFFVLSAFARFEMLKARCWGMKPRITPEFVSKYRKDWYLSCQKAETELGYRITPFAEAVELTFDWLAKRLPQVVSGRLTGAE